MKEYTLFELYSEHEDDDAGDGLSIYWTTEDLARAHFGEYVSDSHRQTTVFEVLVKIPGLPSADDVALLLNMSGECVQRVKAMMSTHCTECDEPFDDPLTADNITCEGCSNQATCSACGKTFDVDEDGANAESWRCATCQRAAEARGADETCRTCGGTYASAGDGYDGECPECADRSQAFLEHEENRSESIAEEMLRRKSRKS